jgi:hypothetical protein
VKKPEFLHFLTFDRHAEFGMAAGLAMMTILFLLTKPIDAASPTVHSLGVVPYGVLWVWLNPYYWVQGVYQIYLGLFLGASLAIQYWFVRKGRLPKWLFYTGWIQSAGWLAAGHVINITVTAFAPLAAVFPPLVLLLIFQKLPLGWSWPIQNNAHWQCAFGNLGTWYCQSTAVRLDAATGLFWQYVALAVWIILPLVVWVRRVRK